MTAPRINSPETAQAEAERFADAVESLAHLPPAERARAQASHQLALNNLLVAMVCDDIASDQFADAGNMIAGGR